jgi:hypothetical protein
LLFARRKRGRQHACNGCELRIERQFSERHIARHFARRQHAHRRQESKRDRQIVVASFLGQIGRREIDGDALIGKRQSDRGERSADAFPAFAHRLVGKAYDVENARAAAIADMDLNVHLAGFDTLERNRVDVCDGHALEKANPAVALARAKRARVPTLPERVIMGWMRMKNRPQTNAASGRRRRLFSHPRVDWPPLRLVPRPLTLSPTLFPEKERARWLFSASQGPTNTLRRRICGSP